MCSWQHGPRSTDVTSVCRAQGLWGGGGRHTFTHRRACPLTMEEGGHPGKKLWLERRQHFRLAGGGAATVPIHWESPRARHGVCVPPDHPALWGRCVIHCRPRHHKHLILETRRDVPAIHSAYVYRATSVYSNILSTGNAMVTARGRVLVSKS